MISVTCPIEVELLDRRRKFVTKNSFTAATAMIRKIENGFHIEITVGSKKEIYVSYKLQGMQDT